MVSFLISRLEPTSHVMCNGTNLVLDSCGRRRMPVTLPFFFFFFPLMDKMVGRALHGPSWSLVGVSQVQLLTLQTVIRCTQWAGHQKRAWQKGGLPDWFSNDPIVCYIQSAFATYIKSYTS